MNRVATYLPAFGRLLLSGLFIWAGYGKLMDPVGSAQYFAAAGVPAPSLMVWITIIVELGGGLAILVGLKARWVAGVLAIWCLATGFAVHFVAATSAADAMVAYDNMIHFYKNLGLAGGFLYVLAFGAGALSFDARRGAR
ncbi:DoxX family protein [Limobrevibacterium gyesilva]|uniref:DoxX family protein n=1 Tax=Limobrevibacterium gyesilva TaxID=2991712 RepID=A0AA41YMC8_9PROT|nr:DoxX family protein [Limobrevibacterium gyesilva]MCW3474628.1 DoxX family protein [Limobrevibacterium gyesilva]